MNPEWYMITLMGAGVILFPAGGTDFFGRGFKWLRRFVLPAIFLGVLLISGVLWWKALVCCLGLCFTFHLGYGSSKSYIYKTIVFTSYMVPTLILGFHPLQIISPVVILGAFKVSNSRWGRWVPHKMWEGLTGFLVGLTLAVII